MFLLALFPTRVYAPMDCDFHPPVNEMYRSDHHFIGEEWKD